MRHAVLLLVAATTLASTLGSAFLPYLAAQQPVVLLLSSADARNIVLAAPHVDLPTMLLIAVPRRALGMIATCGLGVLYGRSALAWSARRFPRVSRFIDKLEAVFARFDRASLVFWPTYTTSALAGARGTTAGRYLPWMVVGQTIYVAAYAKVGAALSVWTDRAIRAVSPYLVEATVATVALACVYQGVAYARRRSRAASDEAESGR